VWPKLEKMIADRKVKTDINLMGWIGDNFKPSSSPQGWEDAPAFSRRAQTETPEFKRWFGDSKVSDNNGDPLMVYRGNFRDYVGRSEVTGPLSFTEFPQIASVYASKQDFFGDANYVRGSQIVPAYLSIERPLKISTVGVNFGKLMNRLQDTGEVNTADVVQIAREVLDRYASRRGPSFQVKIRGYDNTRWFVNNLADAAKKYGLVGVLREAEAMHVDAFALVDNSTFSALLEKHGYDGVIHKDVFQGGLKYVERLTGRPIDEGAVSARGEHWTYRPFKETQVKSAVGNSGAFDRENADINFSQRARAEDKEVAGLFRDLQDARGLGRVRALERVDAHPMAETIRRIDQEFMDILERLDDAGLVKINCK
jgi:hypothetical protein